MNLTYAGGLVSLNYTAGTFTGEKTVFLFSGQTESVVTVVISFEVRENTLRLSLGLNTPAEFLPDDGIPLPGPLTGGGTFQLGASPGEAGMGTDTGTGTDKKNTPSGQILAEEAGNPADTEETADPVSTTEAAVQTGIAETPDPVPVTETAAAVWDDQTPVPSAEIKSPSPVVILDEIVFLVVLDTLSNNETQIAAEVPASSAGISEAVSKDVSKEAISEGDTRTASGSGKAAGALEAADSVSLNVSNKTGDASSSTE
jgi:hypothetical protein